jgi:hypothetical protein
LGSLLTFAAIRKKKKKNKKKTRKTDLDRVSRLPGFAASSGAEMRIKLTASVSCFDTKYLHLCGQRSGRFSLEHFVCWRRKSSCETLRAEIVTEQRSRFVYERLIFALEADQLIKLPCW